MTYIYGIVNTSSDHLIYVGVTNNLTRRFAQHKSTTLRDVEDPCRMEIIEKGDYLSKQDEFFWIAYFKSLGCNLLNRHNRLVYGGIPANIAIVPFDVGSCQCMRCGHKWHSMKDRPVSCPRCKTYKWEGK